MYEIENQKALKYFKGLATITLIFVITYAACYFIFGNTFSIPSGSCFAVILVWVIGHVGGFLAVQCRIPALLGMLAFGVLIENVPGALLRGYQHSWAVHIKSFGLATILMRAGLKINYTQAFRQAPWTVVLLGAVPVFVEGFLDAAIFNTIYGMPFLLAGMAGFLLSAISPTVIVTGMLDLQKKGFGAGKNIPSIEMAAAGVDVVSGIAMFSIFESLAIEQASGSGTAWGIASGPASVGLGVVASLLGGIVCGCTEIFSAPLSRTLIVFCLGQMFMFIFFNYNMTGGGALSTIGTAGIASICWQFGFPKALSTGKSDAYRTKADEHLAVFWMYIMQPLLFCTIGTTVNFGNIPAIVVPKALLVICVGAICRVISAFLSTIPAKWGMKEMLFVALSWIPKATVQGALSSQPLDSINAALTPADANYAAYENWGQEILATAVLAIFVTAPIGLLIISMAGPKLLQKEKVDKDASRLIRTSLQHGGHVEVELIKASALKERDLQSPSVGHALSAMEQGKSARFMFNLQMDTEGLGKTRDRGVQVNPRYFEITDQSRQSVENKRNSDSFEVFGSMPSRLSKVTFQLPVEGVDTSGVHMQMAQSMPAPGMHGDALIEHKLSSSTDAAVEVSRASHTALGVLSRSADAQQDTTLLVQPTKPTGVLQSAASMPPTFSPNNV